MFGSAARSRSTHKLSLVRRVAETLSLWAVVACVPILAADEFEWSNPDGGAFGTDGNWQEGAAPTPEDEILFGIDNEYAVDLAENAVVDRILVRRGDVSFSLNKHLLRTLRQGAEPAIVIGDEADAAARLRLAGGFARTTAIDLAAGEGADTGMYLSAGAELAADGYVAVGRSGAAEISLVAGSRGGGQGLALGMGPQASGAIRLENSEWMNSGFRLDVGMQGLGDLVVGPGSRFSNIGDGVVAFAPGSTGAVQVNGPEASWLNTGVTTIGRLGQGNLTVTSTGLVKTYSDVVVAAASGANGNVTLLDGEFRAQAPNARTIFGDGAGSNGLLTAIGDASQFAAQHPIEFGREGIGSARILNGASLVSAADASGVSGVLGRGEFIAEAVGEVLISGDGSSWKQDGRLIVGGGGSGVLNINNGGVVTSAGGEVGGLPGGLGEVNLAGGGSIWELGSGLSVGGGTDGSGGQGRVHIGDDATVAAPAATIFSGGVVSLDQGSLAAELIDIQQGGGLAGVGLVQGQVHNGGVLSLPRGTEPIVIEGEYQQNDGGTLFVQLAAGAQESDRFGLQVAGRAALNGSLLVTLAEDFEPSPRDEFVILRSEGVEGVFANAPEVLRFEQGSFDVLYSDDAVILTGFDPRGIDGNPLPVGLVLDLNLFTRMKDHFLSNGGLQNGDLNNDGVIDLADFTFLKEHFGERFDDAEVVPEPGAFALTGIAGLAFSAGLWRRRRSAPLGANLH